MATSLLLMASDQADAHDKNLKPLCGSEETKTESSRNRARKANGKGPNQKKQPQRGLGVAQLESLRIQETLKKMTETSALPVLPLLPNQRHLLHCHPPLSPFPVHDPFSGVPLRYGAPANHGPLQPAFNGNIFPGLDQGPPIGGGGAAGWLVTNQVNMVDSYGVGAPVWSPLVGSPLETSKELSSMPNVHSESERCDFYLKKKRFSEDSVKGSNTRRDKPSDIWPINGPDFLGFSPQQVPNLTGETTDHFTPRTTRHAATSYVARNLDEFVEVVAVHRKGNSMTGRVFMEYEFFPGKDGRGSTSKEMELPTVGSAAVGGEVSSSSITTAAAAAATANYYNGDTASNSIDLSLKLSY